MEDSLIRIAYVDDSRSAKKHTERGTVTTVQLPEKKYGLFNVNNILKVVPAPPVKVGTKELPAVYVVVSAGNCGEWHVVLEEDFYDVFGYTEGTIGIDKDFHGMVSELIGEAEV